MLQLHSSIAMAALCAAGSCAFAQVEPPPLVLGKEYITAPNTNSLGIPTTGQTVGWSGIGPAFDLFVLDGREIDAMAHMGDLYLEYLIIDEAAMVVSFNTAFPGGPPMDPVTGGGVPASLWYRNSSPFGSSSGVWATAPMLNPMAPPMQTSGVELHGPAGDTTHWSTLGDAGGVSVTTAAGPYLLNFEIGTAIGATEAFDLDALMILDHFGGTELFHPGDLAVFSVAANGQFDGGELWVLERNVAGTLVASFLEHGGVTWDTDNDVAGLFGMFPPTEDIDALEAIVPAPGAMGLLALAGAWTTGRRRRTC